MEKVKSIPEHIRQTWGISYSYPYICGRTVLIYGKTEDDFHLEYRYEYDNRRYFEFYKISQAEFDQFDAVEWGSNDGWYAESLLEIFDELKHGREFDYDY